MSDSAKFLLNINFDKESFIKRSQQVFTITEQRLLNNSKSTLNNIVKTYLSTELAQPQHIDNKKLIEKTRNISKEIADKGKDLGILIEQTFTMSELRKLSYALFEFNEEDTLFNTAVNILNYRWRDQYLRGMLFVLLNYWLSLKTHLKSKLSLIIQDKLKNHYSGNSKSFLLIKANVKYIDSTSGAYQLAATSINSNLEPFKIPQLIGLEQSSTTFSYFDEVFSAYYTRKIHNISTQNTEENSLNLIKGIDEILDYTSSQYISKVIIPTLVIKVDNLTKRNQTIEDSVIILSNKYIGSTSIDSKWSPYNKDDIEALKDISDARIILRRWEIQKQIELIFHKWDADKDRLNFWLQKIRYIQDIRLIGAQSIKDNFSLIPELKNQLNDIFITTDSSSAQTSALAMHIKNHIFIEFSDVGAIYAYEANSSHARFYKQKRISNIGDIKQTYLPVLIEYYYDSVYWENNGRMIHSQLWREKMNRWFSYALKIHF